MGNGALEEATVDEEPGSAGRRRRLSEDAQSARASKFLTRAAILAVIIYNLVGLADIASTTIAISSGAGEEANPFVRAMMEHAGQGWIFGKLLLQGVITVMVLWFPHWIVLTFFSIATLGNAFIVYNNFVIAGVF